MQLKHPEVVAVGDMVQAPMFKVEKVLFIVFMAMDTARLVGVGVAARVAPTLR
jgi:hypothetical protein